VQSEARSAEDSIVELREEPMEEARSAASVCRNRYTAVRANVQSEARSAEDAKEEPRVALRVS